MFESEYELSYDEENQIEQPANIYSIVKTLEFIVFIILIYLYIRNGHLVQDISQKMFT
jgi:hypothetical protein